MANLMGKTVGRLTVISPSIKQKNRCAWLCRCSCGNEVVVLQQSLVKHNPTQSCGCFHSDANAKDLQGQKFGFWTVKVLSDRKKKPNGGRYWFCVCECGKEREIAAESLLSEKSLSCGCSKDRPICPKGHAIAEWGRDKTGMCRGCIKNRNFIRNYGITLLEYLALWEFQKGLCAICGEPVSVALGRPGFTAGCRAELDHEHNNLLEKKRQVRGILCGGRWSGCNRKIGRIDKIDWVLSVAKYLQNPPARQLFLHSESQCLDSLAEQVQKASDGA